MGAKGGEILVLKVRYSFASVFFLGGRREKIYFGERNYYYGKVTAIDVGTKTLVPVSTRG